jgi:hypothetical protein
MNDAHLDRLIYGAKAIAIAGDIMDAKGNPDIRKTFYALEMGYIDADKFGKKWRSTLRRVRAGQPPRRADSGQGA